MVSIRFMRQFIVAVTAASFLTLGLQSASAAPISTDAFLAAEARASHLATSDAALARADVRAELVALGVDPADAATRAAALSDQELAEVATQLDAAPTAGDGLFALIGVVFIVLLILEITGVTDIFKKI